MPHTQPTAAGRIKGSLYVEYNPLVLPELNLEDTVTLRKPHPCGGFDWKIVRLGADIGLECLICKRTVLLPRRELARRLKKHRPGGSDGPQT